jgi:hypothetical protein
MRRSFMRRMLVTGLLGGRQGVLEYSQRQKNVYGTSLIQQLPMTPTALATDQSGAGRNGDAVAVASDNAPGPFGINAPYFDGTAYVNLYSAGMAAAYSGAEGSFSIWSKVPIEFWTGAQRYVVSLRGDDSNRNVIYHDPSPNWLLYRNIAGGADITKYVGSQSSTDWRMYTMTWSRLANLTAFYINDSQVHQAAGIGLWTTALNSFTTNLGCNNKSGVTYPYLGWMMYWALGNQALTPAEVASLYVNPT